MKLVGRYRSPFTRRVAVSARILGIDFEHLDLTTMTDAEEIRKYNPMTRVPVAVLDDGTSLIDSSAIVDWLDQQVEPERRLVPASGDARRDVLQFVSWATGAADKSVVTYYELTRRPEDRIHMPAVDGNLEQIRAAFGVLDAAAAGGGWLVGGRMTQADVTAVICFEFAADVLGERLVAERFSGLGGLRDRAYAGHPAFTETAPR